MTSEDAKQIIESGWLSAGIRDSIRLGLNKLPSIDPFDDIDPMMETTIPEANLRSVCHLEEEEVGVAYSQMTEEPNDSSDDSDWDLPDEERGAFNIFQEFDDENF